MTTFLTGAETDAAVTDAGLDNEDPLGGEMDRRRGGGDSDLRLGDKDRLRGDEERRRARSRCVCMCVCGVCVA